MRTITFLALILISAYSKSQTSIYHPFPDSNAVWNEEGVATFGGAPPEWYHWQQRYFINGDTTINYTYHKIYLKRVDEYPHYIFYCQPYIIPGISQPYYYGAIRQDTLLKRVYFLPEGTLNDTLLYDFNLSLGDTLPPAFNHQVTLIVSHVDSMFDGISYRKYFSLATAFQTDSVAIIEGIGSTRGLFWWLDPPFEAGNTLRCFEQNGATLFTDSCPYACDMATSINSIDNNNISTQIFPNPFHSTATIEINSNFENSELIIFNILGVKTKSQKIFSSKTIINREFLQNGIYFYQVNFENGSVVKGKFVVD